METKISHTEIVNASLYDVWQHLLYKIDHPEKFVPNVSDVEVIEKNVETTLRKMKITMPDKSMTIIEKIIASPYVVRFEIMEHPTVKGYVENLAEAVNEKSTKLTYIMNWQNTLDNSPANNADMLKAAVNKSKLFIEESTERKTH